MTSTSASQNVEDKTVQLENCLAENGALKRKLHSKAEALVILTRELESCRSERDQFKLMAEQVQNRYASLKKRTQTKGLTLSMHNNHLHHESESSLAELLCETKEQNKMLKTDVEEYKQKLKDAQSDIKILRNKLTEQRSCSSSTASNVEFPSHEREELVQQLETLNMKCGQLSHDLKCVLDEKEELVTERDAFKCKVHRLNFELNALMKNNPDKLVDVDSLITENRYLLERLEQAQEEKQMAQQNLAKYKGMLEKKRPKGAIRMGSNNGAGIVMSHKQVQQLLGKGPGSAGVTMADLHCLAVTLLESLGDKTTALTHQKKSNKLLAKRVTDLEARLAAAGISSSMSLHSLLDGYSGSEVDKEFEQMMQNEASARLENRTTESIAEEETDKEQEITYQENGVTSKAGEEKSSECDNDTGNDCENSEDVLPPELQKLVQQALDEIKKETISNPS